MTPATKEISPNVKHARETWLHQAGEIIISKLFSQHNVPAPKEGWRVSCGFPPSRVQKVTGVCFSTKSSTAGVNEIFLNPMIADTIEVLETLTHELVHAADDCEHGHRGPFAKWARAVGLEGKLTATTPSADLVEWFNAEIVSAMGIYPHQQLRYSKTKKQSTRMVKLECSDCGFVCRTTKKWIMQLPIMATCPCCESDSLERAID